VLVERAQVDPARLSSLAKPRDRSRHRLIEKLKEKEASNPSKEQKLAKKLKNGKHIDFSDFIDREVPHIATDGKFAKIKAPK
jgi:hypothetical protein